jgi:hypothetical protein
MSKTANSGRTSGTATLMSRCRGTLVMLVLCAFAISVEAVQYQVVYVPVNVGINGKNVVIRRPVVRPVASPPSQFALTVSRTGTGTVTSIPTGINCGPTCSANFASGTTISLTATPASGFQFAGWSGGCSGTTTCTVAMTKATTVSADFTAVSTAGKCTQAYYSAWTGCVNGTQSRVLTGGFPANCVVDAPILSQTCSSANPGDAGASAPAAALRLNTPGQIYTLQNDISAAGTAISITADNVTLDLNGRTVTYNTAASSSAVYGIYVGSGVDRITIRNGIIVQGAGRSTRSPAIQFSSNGGGVGPQTAMDLVIRTTGFESNGIQAGSSSAFNNSQILRCYIEVLGGTTSTDGAGADPINVSAQAAGGVQIHDNILVAGHRGMQLAYVGNTVDNQSNIYNNRIQQSRSLGSKAPYGVLLARSHNVHIYDNQIISDDGRGIILDGWDQGSSEGATRNFVYRNRIDVQYSIPANNGSYVENNVYGIRDRYSSGDNTIEDNTVMVANDISGDIKAFYVGSDASDPLMKNIILRNNTVIGRRGTPTGNRSYAFQFDSAASVSVIGNRYLADVFTSGTGSVTTLTVSGNTPLPAATSAPTAPKAVQVTRFLDSFMISWATNPEPDVYEYAIYRDGIRLPISTRGGQFYVDAGIGGTHSYSVSAINVGGRESARSGEVSTATARNAWW